MEDKNLEYRPAVRRRMTGVEYDGSCKEVNLLVYRTWIIIEKNCRGVPLRSDMEA
jgi:hypothetical protein